MEQESKVAVGERITVGLLHRVAGQLNALSAESGMTKTDVVNRAITLYDFVTRQIDNGNDVLVRDKKTGEIDRIKLV